jgi:hypothetical protein
MGFVRQLGSWLIDNNVDVAFGIAGAAPNPATARHPRTTARTPIPLGRCFRSLGARELIANSACTQYAMEYRRRSKTTMRESPKRYSPAAGYPAPCPASRPG